jgi:hypothetical protein
MYCGMPPLMIRPCSSDLWQLRSHSTTWLRPMHAMKMMRLDVEEPLVTV